MYIVESLLIQTRHIQSVMERGSDSGVGRELFVLFVHILELRGGFYSHRSDEVFVPLLKIVELKHFGEGFVTDKEFLNHYCSSSLICIFYNFFILYFIFYQNNNLDSLLI